MDNMAEADVKYSLGALTNSVKNMKISYVPTVVKKERKGVKSERPLSKMDNIAIKKDVSKRCVLPHRENRRKLRPKKLSLNSSHDTSDSNTNTRQSLENVAMDKCSSTSTSKIPVSEFKITAIKSQKTGKVLGIKQNFCKPINTKRLKYLNENSINQSLNSCCTCNCHIKRANNVSIIRDGYKFSVDKKYEPTSSTIKQLPLPDSNNLNLQSEGTSKSLQYTSNAGIGSSKKKNRPKREKRFPQNYWNTSEVKFGLESGALTQGVLRINAKNFREAYVSSNSDEELDYLLPSVLDRNRALDGDVVAIKLKPESEWTERLKTAFVVYILERVHPRTAVGFLHVLEAKDARSAVFVPRDVRIPRMRIPIKSCPPGLLTNPSRYEKILYRGRMVDWTDIKFARGEILENLGCAGDLESETVAILAEHGLDVTPFRNNGQELFKITETIPEKEFEYREDLRKECIFTIDPMTARDLDDAVSCEELDNGNLEVGVHISDVAFFLPEGSKLDNIVCKKATTIYMVNNVYHMLPEELCLHCSLLPGKDKLAFSVFWEMTKSGKILSERFARTIINSCAQLSYEHAQAMIENPNQKIKDGDLPQIHGGFTAKDISKRINYLQAIAVKLRNKRFENGALRIDQTKLLFRIDEDTGEPSDFFVYENKEAHRLIEEFMLQANISVATKIANDFPDKAFLRCHEPPKMNMLTEVKKTLQRFDIDIDVSSSKALHSSMLAAGEKFGVAQMAVLNHLLAKPMMRARYFCSGDLRIHGFDHYALHVPIYTHFTSPIRRYADIMVHRLLAASLGYTKEPNWNGRYVASVADNCNKQKYSAKLAGEASCELYLAHYVAEHQPFVRDAVVIDIKATSFEVLVFSTGSVIKMFSNNLGKGINCEMNQEDKKLTIKFAETPELPKFCYEIKLFSVVKVALQRKPKTIKLEATLIRPFEE